MEATPRQRIIQQMIEGWGCQVEPRNEIARWGRRIELGALQVAA